MATSPTPKALSLLTQPLFGKGDVSGHAFHGNQYTEGQMASEEKNALETVRSAIKSDKMGRYADDSAMGDRNVTDDSKYGGGHSLHVGDFGDWKNPPEARDEEDYDHQVPTKETVDRMKSIVASAEKQHPNVKFRLSGGEKNWIYINARHVGRSR